MLRPLAAVVVVAMGASSASAQSIAPGPRLIDSTGNGVLEPSETIRISPSWANNTPMTLCLRGDLDSFTGPPGATYSIVDGQADYGCLAPFGGFAYCSSDCYEVRVDAAPRPVHHWDVSMHEQIAAGGSATWTLHVGATFADVAPASPFYPHVERILHHRVTGGCGGTAYCPAAPATREQMAVFVLAAKNASFTPPACTTPMFADVPATSPFCRWIEELARRGIVAGCGGGNYCPAAPVTREEMAVFVLKTYLPTMNPPACTTPVFADVPASSPFCRWIEELVRRNVVSGCGGGNYCPTSPVTREQMSVFLTGTFGLAFPGQ